MTSERVLRRNPQETHIHLVGIGGAGLSAIARLLLGRGYRVSGSDMHASGATRELAALGATVFSGHRAEQIAGADLLLISSAVPNTNPEVVAAKAADIPLVKREQFLAPLMAGYLNICVAGTHGKTTTSALLAQLLDLAGAEPSFIVGSKILNLGVSARNGRSGGPFVLEADEYDHMFLGLRPRIAVITNVEWDHVDIYPDPASYRQAFGQFAALVPPDGAIIYCGDDPGAQQIRAAAPADDLRWIAYGLGAGHPWRAENLSDTARGGVDFDLWRGDDFLGRASLPLAGQHNVLNALAALAAAAKAGYVFTKGYKNLKILRKTAGTARRLEQKGESCGIIVLDDYAHHPTEVRATLSAARQRFPRRGLWVLFQPHTYSRTRALLNDFCHSFENADHVLITDIFAAREHIDMGVSSPTLVKSIADPADVRYAGDLDAATATLLAELQAGNVLLTLGAGDGYQVGERVLAALRQREASRAIANSRAALEALAEAIERDTGISVYQHKPLAEFTTMRIGGPADLCFVAGDLDHLIAAVGLARRHDAPVTLLGGGSNVLISDRGVRGLVIINHCRAVRRHEGDVVWAESGVNLAGLARQTMRWGLGGLEWGVSVPGVVGGAVVGNAGAYGGSIAGILLRATLLMPDGSIAEWPARRLHFTYRDSAIKTAIRAGETPPLVLAAAFQLVSVAPANTDELTQRAAGFLARRRASQPVEPSAGSIFQNPPGDYAGRILESLGFKGHRRGGASFSTVHANFIVNLGGATAEDVAGLIDEARRAAWQALGIQLTPEILPLGDWPAGSRWSVNNSSMAAA